MRLARTWARSWCACWVSQLCALPPKTLDNRTAISGEIPRLPGVAGNRSRRDTGGPYPAFRRQREISRYASRPLCRSKAGRKSRLAPLEMTVASVWRGARRPGLRRRRHTCRRRRSRKRSGEWRVASGREFRRETRCGGRNDGFVSRYQNHSFDEDDIGDLADLLPGFFGGEDGGVGAREEFARIAAVEDGNAGAIDELIVGAVVNENDAARGEDRRRAGLDDTRVKFSRAAGKNRG